MAKRLPPERRDPDLASATAGQAPIAAEDLDDVVEMALQAQAARKAASEAVVSSDTLSAVASEFGLSTQDLLAGKATLDRQRVRQRRRRWTVAGLAMAVIGYGGYRWFLEPVAESVAEHVAGIRNANDRLLAKDLADQGNVLRRAGRYGGAVPLYEQALALDPEDVNLWNNLGICHKELGQTDRAERAYRRAILLAKGTRAAGFPLYNLANMLDDGPRYREAIQLYQAAIRVRSDDADFYNNLAVVQKRVGNRQEALTLYRMALAISPKHVKAARNLRRLQAEMDTAARPQ